ncbi:M28 family metallopeptidase [Rhizorhabdus dicambivorans]|uniref:Peptidase M28 n=1 Tax=Rhizorhabdus dicambivorans TaxID=1850238 RepID=A0A2A4FZZ3_9SPHN|nr:M28 family metallopeptidase [Rhizorhabdus dicambivorans]ATE63130.1 peptidase M28 [Rhizorhabdus dicambivorans]PCE43307.1 peptidase M28 [Rhizorhabdus dicambivorans]
MIISRLAALALLATPIAITAEPPADSSFSADRFRATVGFLADDLLKGRDTGSEGYEIAARYVASRFAELGLKPGGDDGGWYQRITFQQTDFAETPGQVTITGPGGASQSWTHGTDVLVGLSANEPHLDLSAPLVFVGYGIENKLLGINDYAGLDVKGKIVVTLRGFPQGMPSEEAAHAAATKAQAAQAHGAIGMLSVGTNLTMKTRPWAQMVHFADEPAFAWVGADGKAYDEAPGIRITAALNEPAAQALFAGAPQKLAAIRAMADKAGGRPKGFALKTRARIRSDSVTRRVTSPNIIAILPGSDPKLKAEYVVLSAHLDHIGVTPARPGDKPETDRINNGALDNGAGIATMLEVARAAATAPDKPRRSLIFLASTAEEKGLLGADYYARHPGVPIRAIVGNVDLDMPLLLYPFTDVTAFGADHSTLGPIVAKAVEPMGITLSPDPMPAQTIFVRSDHYMFVKQGVPAVFLATGFANGGDKHWGAFLNGAYHHPDDDMNQKILWDQGARFSEANYRIMRAMADADVPPRWYAKDFFGDTFAPKAEKAKRP